jgi:hypothetical protein
MSDSSASSVSHGKKKQKVDSCAAAVTRSSLVLTLDNLGIDCLGVDQSAFSVSYFINDTVKVNLAGNEFEISTGQNGAELCGELSNMLNQVKDTNSIPNGHCLGHMKKKIDSLTDKLSQTQQHFVAKSAMYWEGDLEFTEDEESDSTHSNSETDLKNCRLGKILEKLGFKEDDIGQWTYIKHIHGLQIACKLYPDDYCLTGLVTNDEELKKMINKELEDIAEALDNSDKKPPAAGNNNSATK